MLGKLPFLLLFLILKTGLAEAGQDVLAVQSLEIAPYEEAIEGFASACNCKVKRLFTARLQIPDLEIKIRQIRPDLVLATGMEALLKVEGIKHVPVVYLMVLNHPSLPAAGKNITGASMHIAPEKQLRTALKALPGTKKIGLLYDPDRSFDFVRAAQLAAEKTGITLIAKKVHSPRDVPYMIDDMKGNIDLFWMLPDITVITPETVESLILFSMENNVPVLSFSKKYVELGALMSIGIDAFDMGRQAAGMADKILSGKDVADVRPVYARKAVVWLNMKVAKKMKIAVDDEFVSRVDIIK